MAMVASGRMDLTPLVTHVFELDAIKDAYELFSR
jgi:threonine dehydrogenase-like Zn-dependent dehydrogenase